MAETQPAYSMAQAAKRAQITAPSARNYTSRWAALYAPYFTAGAMPQPAGAARSFAESDVRVLQFIAAQTDAGFTHEATAAKLAESAGVPADWAPPEKIPQERKPHKPKAAPSVALVLQSTIVAELATMRAREDALTDRLIASEAARAAAEARAEQLAQELQRARLPWWRRLFG